MKNLFTRVTALFMVLLMMFSLSACSGNANEPANTPAPVESGEEAESPGPAEAAEAPEPAEPVTLRVGWWGSQVRTDATLEVLDMYTEKTGVQFEAEYMPFDGYFTKFVTMAAAGDLFDVYQLGGGFEQYMEQIEPLNDYIDRGLIDTSDLNQAILDLNTVGGQVCGITLGVNAYASMAYDPELFAQAGVPEPTDDWTWADYESAVTQIHEKLGIYGSSKITVENCGAQDMYFDTGENRFWKKDADGLGFDADDLQPIVNFLAMMQRLVNAGAYPDPGVISEIKDIEGDLIVNKEAAITMISSNQFLALSQVADRPLKMVFLPKRDADSPTPTAMNSSQMFSVYNKSENKDEAAKFISYFVNDIDANMVLKGERGIPAATKVREAVATELDEINQVIYEFMDRVAAGSEMDPRNGRVGVAEVQDLYVRLYEQVVTNQITPEDAAVEFRAGADEIIANAL